MTLLDNDQFIAELTKIFQKSRFSGPRAVTVTLKHYDGRTKPRPKVPVVQNVKRENLCLFRAKSGKKVISTVVHAKEVNKFHIAYVNVLRAQLDSMKRRERKAMDGKTKEHARKVKKAQ